MIFARFTGRGDVATMVLAMYGYREGIQINTRDDRRVGAYDKSSGIALSCEVKWTLLQTWKDGNDVCQEVGLKQVQLNPPARGEMGTDKV